MTISSNRTQGAGSLNSVSTFCNELLGHISQWEPIQRHWSRCSPCMWGGSFSAVWSSPESCQSRGQQQKRCAASFLGSQWWQVAQQELHPSSETELFADGNVPSQLHLLNVQFSNRSIICLSLLVFASLSPPFTQNLKPQPILHLFLGKRTAQRDSALNVMEIFANEWALVTRKCLIDSGHQITWFN